MENFLNVGDLSLLNYAYPTKSKDIVNCKFALIKIKDCWIAARHDGPVKIERGFPMSDLSIFPVAIFSGMVLSFAAIMLFAVLTDKDPSKS